MINKFVIILTQKANKIISELLLTYIIFDYLHILKVQIKLNNTYYSIQIIQYASTWIYNPNANIKYVHLDTLNEPNKLNIYFNSMKLLFDSPFHKLIIHGYDQIKL